MERRQNSKSAFDIGDLEKYISQKTATGEGNLRHVQIEEENALEENEKTLAEDIK